MSAYEKVYITEFVKSLGVSKGVTIAKNESRVLSPVHISRINLEDFYHRVEVIEHDSGYDITLCLRRKDET